MNILNIMNLINTIIIIMGLHLNDSRLSSQSVQVSHLLTGRTRDNRDAAQTGSM